MSQSGASSRSARASTGAAALRSASQAFRTAGTGTRRRAGDQPSPRRPGEQQRARIRTPGPGFQTASVPQYGIDALGDLAAIALPKWGRSRKNRDNTASAGRSKRSASASAATASVSQGHAARFARWGLSATGSAHDCSQWSNTPSSELDEQAHRSGDGLGLPPRSWRNRRCRCVP